MWLPKLDRRLGRMWIMKIKLNLLISSQKLYVGNDDAIYDVIIQEAVWKWRHKYRPEISRDPFSESVLFQTYSTIFIFRKIDRANFVVRGPSSLYILVHSYKLQCNMFSFRLFLVVFDVSHQIHSMHTATSLLFRVLFYYV